MCGDTGYMRLIKQKELLASGAAAGRFPSLHIVTSVRFSGFNNAHSLSQSMSFSRPNSRVRRAPTSCQGRVTGSQHFTRSQIAPIGLLSPTPRPCKGRGDSLDSGHSSEPKGLCPEAPEPCKYRCGFTTSQRRSRNFVNIVEDDHSHA